MEETSQNYIVYAGVCKTESKRSGIYAGIFHTTENYFEPLKLVYKCLNVRALRVCERNNILYAVIYNGDNKSEAIAFKIDKEKGNLKELNRLSLSATGISFLNLDRKDSFLLMPDYVCGKITMISLNPDGSIDEFKGEWQHSGKSINQKRQSEPHPHSIYTDANNNFVVVPDLGTDELVIYKLESDIKTLIFHSKIHETPGAGPRHFAFHPSNKYAYLLSELDMRISTYEFDSDKGRFYKIQSVNILNEGYDKDSYGGDIQISDDGELAFASMRAAKHSVSVFSIDKTSGMLEFIANTTGHGSMRDIKISKNGKFIFGVDEDAFGLQSGVEIFHYHKDTEILESIQSQIKLPNTFCIDIIPVQL